MRFVSRSIERVFTSPADVVVALTPADVIPCLERVAAAVAQGSYAAGFITYEAAPAFDPAMRTQPPGDLPLLWFGIYQTMEQGPVVPDKSYTACDVGPWTPLVSAEEYQHNIQRIREWIAAGDTYQVNYTFPLQATFQGDALSWFRRLCAAQQADYCAYVDLGRHRLLSASPELFFRLKGNTLETSPMKGTRPRGRWAAEDQEMAHALIASEKDRAENIMIVDLLRNDMSRISEAGSVQVHSLYDVESFPTVWQMTSTIRSRTRASVPEIIRALFPCGSVTGAPKIRTMEIIRELEPHPRGVYCGTIGWWTPDGQAEFNVAIRTVTIDAQSGQTRYHIGSGITYGSSAEDEYEECLIKASLLTRRDPEFELIETLRYDGAYFLLSEHLERLAASARYFGFSCDRPAIEKALLAAVGTDPADDRNLRSPTLLKVRLLLRKDGACQIHREPIASQATLRVGFAAQPVDASDVFLFHKTTCRAVYRQALAARPDCDDVLLWNTRDEITESTIANVVLDLDGARWTPPLASGLLEGTFRRHLLAQGAIAERVLTKKDVLRARAIHLINSVRQWIEVNWMDR
ncbi:MAG: aminodeoxychorismate synthase component I [Verrucomicrobia bacterium]|nr:aminodeoxychorismate synthase component I [Verrucomicrobiota bacterium]MCG2678481.1 aminodeoxychorismate synthase component I [Kiritimatiellia bacterium]MBU4248084.1 aminodeoxychorismate synthase component I [Verrucomicrobiota bacterium]MBU4290240.1 aminodeoxychorismate synthase component I [Verrucomicrobiota bacterium]MBU4429173.1 aminodeoxychorismate synthase component I [Verrucomicrobiota bacterium]